MAKLDYRKAGIKQTVDRQPTEQELLEEYENFQPPLQNVKSKLTLQSVVSKINNITEEYEIAGEDLVKLANLLRRLDREYATYRKSGVRIDVITQQAIEIKLRDQLHNLQSSARSYLQAVVNINSIRPIS
jgi:DNA repair exonuclease SbcCD ATPase subunit